MSFESRQHAAATVFQRFDVNCDGCIVKSRWTAVLDSIGIAWTNNKRLAVFEVIDSNEDGHISASEFTKWVFEDGDDQEAFCEAIGLERGVAICTHTSAVLGVPDQMHHPDLLISENGTVIEAETDGHLGMFLSSVLEADSMHALHVRISHSSCVYIGIYDCKQTPDFEYLSILCFSSSRGGEDFDNEASIPAERHYNPEDVGKVMAEGGITLCVDMCAGRFSVMDRFGLEVGYWLIDGLNDMKVCFAASVSNAHTLKLSVPNFLVNVVAEQIDSIIELRGLTMAGNILTTTKVEDADNTTWRDILDDFSAQIPQAKGFKLAFLLPDGSELNSQRTDSVANIFRAFL